MIGKKNEFLCVLFSLSIAAVLWISSRGLESKTIVIGVGASFMPRVVAVGMAALAVMLAVQAFMRKKDSADGVKNAAPFRLSAFLMTLFRNHADVVSLFLLAGYAFSLQYAGFIIASSLYLFLQMLTMSIPRNRNVVLFAALALIAPVLIYLLFSRVFSMSLPRGIFSI